MAGGNRRRSAAVAMPMSGKDIMNVFFTLTSTVMLVTGPMMSKHHGPNAVFTYHPLLMCVGFALNISLGFWMFNYEDLPGEWIDTRAGRRKAHAFLQFTGACLVCGGYAAVVRAHNGTPGANLFEVSQAPWAFAIGPYWLRLTHIVVGYCTLGLLGAQVMLGLLKYRILTSEDDANSEAYASHELVGNALYSLAVSNILLAVWLWEAWSMPIRAAITLTLLTSLAFGPRWDGSRGFLSAQTDNNLAKTKIGKENAKL